MIDYLKWFFKYMLIKPFFKDPYVMYHHNISFDYNDYLKGLA